MSARRIALVTLAAWISSVSIASAQAPAGFDSLDALKASYAKQAADLERRKIADMTALAARQTGDAMEVTYREIFALAIARDLFTEAEPAAFNYLKTPGGEVRDNAVASYVSVIAKANRGEYAASMADLQAYFDRFPVDADPAKRVDPGLAVAIGEAYLQRLLRGGRYADAVKVCEMISARRSEPEIRDHFRERLARVQMVGKLAPEIQGKDVDGDSVSLAGLKGKVVLIDFWATWCPPCIANVPDLQALRKKYGKDGFEILGVNLDARREDVGSVEKATPIVKRFLLDARISWPNLMASAGGAGDPAAAFGVEEIPASFLIGRDGKIVDVEQVGPGLDEAVAKALKK